MNNVTSKKIAIDLLVALVFLVVIYCLFAKIDLFESLVKFVEAHESWELDEIIIVMLFTPPIFIWFVIRRWKDGQAYWQRTIEREQEFARKLKYDEKSQLPNSGYFEMLVSREMEGLSRDRTITLIVVEMYNLDLIRKRLPDYESVILMLNN